MLYTELCAEPFIAEPGERTEWIGRCQKKVTRSAKERPISSSA